MAADGSAAPQLSDAATSIKIGSRVWKIGDVIYSIGDQAVTKLKMRENFGAHYLHARLEGVILGRDSSKKVRVKWTNLQVPNEFEYVYNHSIFKDPLAQPPKKAQKIVHSSQIAPLAGGVSAAVSNENDVLELHPSSAEVSEAEDDAGRSAGINSLNIGGNDWRVDEPLNSLDPRGVSAKPVRNPLFTWPRVGEPIFEQNPVDFVDLFLHNKLFLAMVEHTNANMSANSSKVDEEEMRRFVGIIFAMTVCPMSNIRDYWNTEDDCLMVASRFFNKLHMSYKRFAEIRKNWAIAPVQRGSKTFDAIRPLFDMFNERAASVFRCSTHVVIDESTSGRYGKDESELMGPRHLRT
jgi:hypothetical protein